MDENFLREAVDNNMSRIGQIREHTYPTENGWINDIRKSLGMSLDILGQVIGVRSTTVAAHEESEKKGTIQLSTFYKYADKLGLEFIYGFCHKGQTLEGIIDAKAHEKALEIINSTYTTMDLEGEMFDKEILMNRINEKKYRLKSDIKNLWK